MFSVNCTCTHVRLTVHAHVFGWLYMYVRSVNCTCTLHAKVSVEIHTPKHRKVIGSSFNASHPPPALCYRPTVFFPLFPLIALYLPPGKIRCKFKKFYYLYLLCFFSKLRNFEFGKPETTENCETLRWTSEHISPVFCNLAAGISDIVFIMTELIATEYCPGSSMALRLVTAFISQQFYWG